jgi:hypothetical protein
MAAHTGQVITWDDALNSDALLDRDITNWDQPPVRPDSSGIYPYPKPGFPV